MNLREKSKVYVAVLGCCEKQFSKDIWEEDISNCLEYVCIKLKLMPNIFTVYYFDTSQQL